MENSKKMNISLWEEALKDMPVAYKKRV